MPDLGIQQFRSVAATAGTFSDAHVRTGSDGNLKADGNFLGRMVNWARGGPGEADKQANRGVTNALLKAITTSYGETTAGAVKGSLQERIDSGKPLTAHVIKDALALAKQDLGARVGVQQNRVAIALEDFPRLLNRMGVDYDQALSPREQQALKQDFVLAVKADPRSQTGELSKRDLADIAHRVMADFEPSAPEASRLGHLANLVRAGQVAKAGLEDVMVSLAGTPGLTDGQKQALQGAVSNLGICLEILTEAPAGRAETEQHLDVLKAQTEVLRAHLGAMGDILLEGEMEPEAFAATQHVCNELEAQIGTLGEHATYLENFLQADPLSEKQLQHASDLWTQTAVEVLKQAVTDLKNGADRAGVEVVEHLTGVSLAPSAEVTQAKVNVLETLIASLESEQGRAVSDNRDATINDAIGDKKAMKQAVKSLAKERPKDLQKQIAAAFKQVGLPTAHLKENLHHAHLDVLNKGQSWDTIDRGVRFTHGGQVHQARSEIRPAAQMAGIFEVPYNGGGVSCATKSEAQHAVNLASTSLKDDQGRTVFEGIRHGVHCAWGIKDGNERVQANDRRAQESVLAALTLKPELMAAALNGATVTLPLTSISLMTPDAIRGTALFKAAKGPDADERTFIREQLDTWKRMNAGTQEIVAKHPDTGQEVRLKIKVDVAAFNFGVNAGAVASRFSGLNMVGGWDQVRTDNEAGLRKLVGDIEPGTLPGGRLAAALNSPNLSSQDKANLRELSEQIRNIWQEGSHMRQGHEPYKLASRVAVLTHLMDQVPMWNCKSGKDRTGMLDGEAKLLAMRIQLLGRVPEPDEVPGPEEQGTVREFLLRTGNLEMQQLNTGIMGFKTEGVKALDERIGSAAARETHRGGSAGVSE
jgi:hypothetical protein